MATISRAERRRSSREQEKGAKPEWATLEAMARMKIQGWIEDLLHEEMSELLGRRKSERRAEVDGKPGYPERIDAFLFLFFIAITIHALLERQLPNAMTAQGIESLPLYPEARLCKAPTADKILALFAHQRRHRLLDTDRHVKTFWDPLSAVQRTVLQLLQVPLEEYGVQSQ